MSSRKLLDGLCLALLLVSAPAWADERTPDSPFLGARLAYALPFGTMTGEVDTLWLYDLYSATIPLTLEGGYRVGPVSYGAYLQYGFAQFHGECPVSTCSGSDIRFGLSAVYHLETSFARTWAGLSAGYELASVGAVDRGISFNDTYSGFDIAAQGGTTYDFGGIQAGPFISLSMGQFGRYTATINGASGVEDLDYRGLHFWFQLGVYARFEPRFGPKHR